MPAIADTIAAISSDTSGSRGIVRASGSEALLVAAQLAREQWPGVRGVRAATIHLSVGALRTLAVTMPAPHSATGEHTVEWLVPSGVAGAVLEATCEAGARPAEPGEFSMRAFLNGKVSLEGAEGVAASIAAIDADGLRAARRLREGRLGTSCDRLQRDILSVLALVEAGIDFTEEEDVVPIESGAMLTLCAEWQQMIEQLSEGAAVAESTSDLPRVVLWGPANAGKSTLFNALLGHARAVASGEAGTTRDALVERLALRSTTSPDLECELVDLPGLPPDGDPFAQAAREVMAREIAGAAVVLACCRLGESVLAQIPDRAVTVSTCSDRAVPGVSRANELGAVEVSAHSGNGMDALREAIRVALASWMGAQAGMMVRARHRRALAATGESLRHAMALAGRDPRVIVDPELVSESLRSCIRHLGDVSGHLTSDDVLGEVFARFCVGK